MISHDQVELDLFKSFIKLVSQNKIPEPPYQLDRNVQTLYHINIIYILPVSRRKRKALTHRSIVCRPNMS